MDGVYAAGRGDDTVRMGLGLAIAAIRSVTGSLTLYDLPQSLLVANPINRYLINSPMLPELVKDADGGVTLYLQNESPGKDKEPNWPPAPKGPFFAVLRIYWPKEAALDGSWKQPPMTKVQ